ncbi:MAG: DUF58 domain-containing protein, partial [Verrucomicrobiae bacterium]|nr:DUF58 domain-containing protein [Verrucomicrobiae bacterium]
LELAWFDDQFSAGFEPESGDEFRGIRPYRSGDPVKTVHWPATARAGELMVREWDAPAPRPQRYGLILHTLEKGGRLLRPDRWEMVLRVAAGLITHCRDRGIALRFAEETGISRPLKMPDLKGYSTGLEALALAQRTTLKDGKVLSRTIENFGTACDRVFVLSDVPLRQWRGMVEGSAIDCPVICLDAESVVPIRKKVSLRLAGAESLGGKTPTSLIP